MLLDIADQIGGNTICALGDAASLPVQSFVRKFRRDFELHVEHGCCPYDSEPLPAWRKP
jgi:NADH-quinone oxidoreductase subunit F